MPKWRISGVIGIPVTDDLGKYLGVPTLSEKVAKATFQHVIDRVDKQLRGWRTKCLSLAVRVTLIKSTLIAIPAYTMQTCWFPRAICDEFDRKVRRFFWAGSNTDQKPHLVAWATVIKPMSLGGLGLRVMRDLNSV